MTSVDFSTMSKVNQSSIYPLIDTHTHFDAPVFDDDRAVLIQKAYENGVQHLVLVGYLHRHFGRMYKIRQRYSKQSNNKAHFKVPSLPSVEQDVNQEEANTNIYVALGLHPFYIEQHSDAHLEDMAKIIANNRPIAIGEIGLDTFTAAMKVPEVFAKQERFFKAQLDIAVVHQLPVMLHIRKAHAEALAILKAHDYDAHKLGGIAHSFSGGVQEAIAFVKLGFKLGVTGQITNPNAKKLRLAIQAAVKEYGIECLVIETDCPDMIPVMCRTTTEDSSVLGQDIEQKDSMAPVPDRNVPSNLPWVLRSLSELLEISSDVLAEQLWYNSCAALQTTWNYPK
ncbi:TatD family hydrolase [Psychrobacter alimentarius]|uniref:TatD family hydrolase n=1 Tax=Psychrobacter alimentarius TaxID=261164 RepID=UPI001D123492|nr:TatD family hydrolase [Psychrobacter alimentarius]